VTDAPTLADAAWLLKERRELPLEVKVGMSLRRIKAWHEHWGGKTHVSFSGGKDSTVLLDLVRSVYPDTPALFVDTGLEYPEIKAFVRTFPNVTTVRPKKSFRQVIEEYGYPVASKLVSRMVRTCRNPTDRNQATRTLYLTGIKRDGSQTRYFKIPNKWRCLLDAPFQVSERCCDVLKKEPFKRYEKETETTPYIGTMAWDSVLRSTQYLLTGCNAFAAKRPASRPLSFWTTDDIWEYIRGRGLPYAAVYDIGVSNTGCVFCAFGAHMEKGETRFQALKRTHPKLHKYCIEDLGMAEVLDYIGVDY